jgi:hypothetical protein
MSKKIHILLMALLLIATGYIAGNYRIPVVHAQQNTAVVPKDWGTVKGSVDAYLIFEASDGTIRITTMSGKLMGQVNRQ